VLHKPNEVPSECIVVFGPIDRCRVTHDRIKMKVGPKECAVRKRRWDIQRISLRMSAYLSK